MNAKRASGDDLVREIAQLRQRVAELEELDRERKQAEAAPRESEQRYRSLAESTTDMIFILDRDGTLLYVNRSGAARFGVLAESLVGANQQSLFPKDLGQAHLESVAEVFDTGEMLEQERQYRFGPNEVWLNSRLVPLRDDQGRMVSVMGVSRDITSRKRAEEAARTAEAKYRRLHESMMDAFVSVDMDGRIQEYNEAYRKMLGYEPEELSALTYVDVTPQKWHAMEAAIVEEQILARGYSDIYEKEYRRKDGTVFPVELRTSVLRDNQGEACAMWAIVRDISERKRAESALQVARDELEGEVRKRTAELAQANQELRASEEKYKTLVEASPDGVVMADLNGHITFASSRVLRDYGADRPEELIGKNPLDILVPEDHEKFFANLRRTIEEGVTHGIPYAFLRKDGSRFPCEISAAVIRDTAGAPVALVAITSDVTERTRAEEALRQSHEALHRERRTLEHMLQASDHERQLIAYDIHDGLAQQLAGAIMQFQIYDHLRDSKPQDAANAYHAGTTLLEQSHFEARRLISGVRPPVLDEAGVVEAIAHLVHEQSRTTEAKIDFRSKVRFDRLAPVVENAIYRIVQEALSNACRHSKSEQVQVSLLQRVDQLRIEVRDWGQGFNQKEVREGAFGLEGIRERARLLGGKWRIETAPGKGTRIAVKLPLVLREHDAS